MLLRTKFIYALVLSLLLVGVLSVIISWQLYLYHHYHVRIVRLKAVVRATGALEKTAYETLFFHPDRAAEQWHIQYTRLLQQWQALQTNGLPSNKQGEVVTSQLHNLAQLYAAVRKSGQFRYRRVGEDFYSFSALRARSMSQLTATVSRMEESLFAIILATDDRIKQLWSNLVGLFIIFSLSFAGLLFGLTRILFRDVLRPLGVLEAGVQRVKNRDFTQPIAIGKSNEIGVVTAAFNQMARTIQAAQDTLEQQVAERTAQLTRSNAELQQFAYAASHDLQEPLRSITGYLGLIDERYRELLAADDRRFIERPIQAAARMQDLIRALLALSRIGTHGKSFQRVDCQELVALVCLDLSQLVTETHASIRFQELPTIYGDPEQIRQLFQNLIVNSIKFRTDTPPIITMRAQQERGRPWCWQFTVQDNGIGFDPQFSERIFHIFQRLHSRATYAGTGIGLALCRKIVERHGGIIQASSQPGHGACFSFSLCAEPEEEDHDQPKPT